MDPPVCWLCAGQESIDIASERGLGAVFICAQSPDTMHLPLVLQHSRPPAIRL
jgi:hypothetical protein